MPEEERGFVQGMRDKFVQLTNHARRKKLFDSTEEDDSPECNDWDAQLAACARSQACREGLMPELDHRIKVMDDMMGFASAEHSELAKVVGARDALRSLRERLLGDEDAR